VLLSDCYENASPKLESKCKVCVWYDTLGADAKAFFDEKISGNVTKLWMACLSFDPDADFSLTTLRRHKQLCLSCR
jgi:hypothetical protein